METRCCSLTKQVRDGPQGGRSASVRLEVEIDAETVKIPGRLRQHIRCGFHRARMAIEDELGNADPENDVTGDEITPTSPRNGRPNGGRDGRPATSSELRLLRALAGRKDVHLAGLCRDRCDKEEPAELSLAEASRLICELGGDREHERR